MVVNLFFYKIKANVRACRDVIPSAQKPMSVKWLLLYYIIFQTTIFYYQIVSGEEFLETIQQTLSGISSKFLTPIFQLPLVPFHVCFLT